METVIGGLFKAVAFAGAGFLFSKLNHTGYEKEIKRHNEALEKLQKDKEKWYEKQVKRKEEIEKLRQRLSDAIADINRTNMSFKTLREMNNCVKSLGQEYSWKLQKYYTTSENEPKFEMKEYQNVAFFLVGISGGFIVYKFI